MKIRKLSALLLSFAMLLSLLSGCGGKESEEDGRGDVISEEQGSDPGDTLDEPEVNFEDFFGCWEYWDYDIWLYVYGDGTYEMYNENGDCTAGSYTPEGTEIVLDSGERFALDGEGGLIDEDGDALFASELPDTWDDEEGLEAPDYEPEAITKENFYGCWKDENRQFWIIFYEDFTYEMYWGEEETGMKGEYELYGEEIRLDAGPRYTPDGEGNLVDVSGDTYYPAEPPSFVYDIVFDDDNDDDGEYENVPAPDDERFEADESDEAYDFCGCWEYQDYDLWLCIYNDGTCEWYDAEGLYGVDTYYIEDGVLYLEQEGVTLEEMFGGLVGSDDSSLYSSMLPDYDGTAMNGGEAFLGCWEDAIDGVWLEINSDGTYLFMWDDGYGASGRCYMDGDELCLQSGTRFYMDYENSVIVSDKYTMFRSEMPDHLR